MALGSPVRACGRAVRVSVEPGSPGSLTRCGIVAGRRRPEPAAEWTRVVETTARICTRRHSARAARPRGRALSSRRRRRRPQPAALIRAVAAGPEWRARGGVLTPAWPSSVAAVATWPERWLRRRSVPGASTPTTCRTGCTPLGCSTRCRGGEKSVVRLPNFSGG